jgi:hypothetical protein
LGRPGRPGRSAYEGRSPAKIGHEWGVSLRMAKPAEKCIRDTAEASVTNEASSVTNGRDPSQMARSRTNGCGISDLGFDGAGGGVLWQCVEELIGCPSGAATVPQNLVAWRCSTSQLTLAVRHSAWGNAGFGTLPSSSTKLRRRGNYGITLSGYRDTEGLSLTGAPCFFSTSYVVARVSSTRRGVARGRSNPRGRSTQGPASVSGFGS